MKTHFGSGWPMAPGFSWRWTPTGRIARRDLDGIVDAARGCGGLAIGSRYIRGGQIVGWPAHRWLLVLGRQPLLPDPARAARRATARPDFAATRASCSRQIGLDEVVSQGYSFQIEMVHRTRRLGYPVVEVPIRFEDRVAGASKVSQGEIRRALWTVLRLSMSR